MENINIENVKTAKARIGSALNILSVQQPALMIYLGLVEMTPVNNPRVTMRLATKHAAADAYLEYNPKFVAAVTDDSVLAYLLYIEGLRLALHHCTQRIQQPAEIHKLSSDLICADNRSVLNIGYQQVKEILGELPSLSQHETELRQLGFKKDSDFCLEKLIGYFRKLQQDQESENNENDDQSDGGLELEGLQGAGEDGAGEDGTKAAHGSSEDQSEGNDEPSDAGNSRGNQGFSMGNESDDYTSMGEALQRHFDASNREHTAEWGENTTVEDGVRRATEILKNSPELWGKLAGNMQALIAKANEPKFDPAHAVARFKALLQSQNVYQSRSKINKKNPDFCGWRHEMETRMLEAIDASGSMSDESVAMGEAFINLFIKRASVDYAFWDTEMSEIVSRGKKKIKVAEQLEVNGRGGTDPRCIINKLNTLTGSKHKYGGVVVFTDCGFVWPDPGPKWRNKILIISTTTREAAPEWALERGRVIALKDIIDWNEKNA